MDTVMRNMMVIGTLLRHICELLHNNFFFYVRVMFILESTYMVIHTQFGVYVYMCVCVRFFFLIFFLWNAHKWNCVCAKCNCIYSKWGIDPLVNISRIFDSQTYRSFFLFSFLRFSYALCLCMDLSVHMEALN